MEMNNVWILAWTSLSLSIIFPVIIVTVNIKLANIQIIQKVEENLWKCYLVLNFVLGAKPWVGKPPPRLLSFVFIGYQGHPRAPLHCFSSTSSKITIPSFCYYCYCYCFCLLISGSSARSSPFLLHHPKSPSPVFVFIVFIKTWIAGKSVVGQRKVSGKYLDNLENRSICVHIIIKFLFVCP